MQKLQLYISGTRVDLFKDESVSITQTIQNVRDIAKIFTEFTQSFTVPASKTNNILFRHYYNFDIAVNSFDARNKVSANIELNNIPFKKGFIRLEGVEMKKNKPYAYKITFFGETVNLKDVLEDDELSALDTLNSNNLDYTATNIRSNLVGNLDTIITPLITHTTQLYYDTGTHVAQDGNLYYQGGGGTNLHGVLFSDLKFAIRLYDIIQAIQTKYSITFSTDFFNSSNPTFYNLYMWLHRKKGDVEPAQQVPMQFTQVSGFNAYNTPSPETSTSNGAIVIPSSLVTYPAQILGFSLDLTPTTNDAYDIQIYRNGSLYYQKTNVQGAETLTDADFTLTAGSFTISIGSASVVTFNSTNIIWEINGQLGGEVIGGYTDIWRSISNTVTSTTFEFIITEQIPKMKIIDFLSALFKMFNLTAFVDDTGTIVVRTLDSYYSASSVVWDINKYVNIDKGTVDIALPYKEVEFKFKGLGTFLAKQFEQLENTGWGTLSYSLDNAKYDAPSESYKVEIPFEHLQYQRLVNATGGADTDIQWGWSVDDNKESYYGSPVIFYAIKITSGTAISFMSSTSANQSESDYIIPSNSRALASGTSTENINFQLETNEYTGGTTFTGTLFENYYKTYISAVFNNRRRLTKVKAQLPLKIIYNLKLNDKISLNNYTYKINSLTTNLTTGESSIELLNEV
nr:hypothetical protein [uncultured Mediterranean phage uvMED]